MRLRSMIVSLTALAVLVLGSGIAQAKPGW